MDFLRRLMPPRPTDASRAVAALPSRYAEASPLAVSLAGSTRGAQAGADPAASARDTAAAPARRHRDAPRGSRLTEEDEGTSLHLSSPRPPGPDVSPPQPPAHREYPFARGIREQPSSAQQGLDGAAPWSRQTGTRVPDLMGFEQRASAPDRPGAAAARSMCSGQHGIAAVPNASHAAAPLSQASIAHRRLQAGDDNPVVHVTIGRIDVVAVSAPQPAARRAAVPRQGTATLADYLRGSNGSRR